MKIATIAGVALASTVAGAGTAVSADVLTVQHGDTLSELAVKHHTSVDDFVKKNGIKDANLIITGQKLTFTHKDNAHAVKKATDTNAHYTVVDGDTLSTIAETYHTTPQAIAELNGMSVDDILHIGTVLTVANHAQPQAHAKTTMSTSKPVAKQTPVANPAQPAKQSSVAQSAKDVKPAVAQPAPSHEKKATPAKATSPDVDQLSEVASSAPNSVASSTAPSSVASSAPSSVASSTAPSSVASSAPSSVASSTAPSSVASSTAPSSVASSTAPSSAPSSIASSTPSSVASSAPSSVASSTAPSSVASSVASSAPSSVASSTAPSSVASSAPGSVASSAPSSVASSAPGSVASSAPSSVASSAPSSVASSTPSSTTPDTTTPTRNQLGTGSLSGVQRSAIVNEAISLTHQNIPYVWGGKTTAGFDCSGLTAYVYGKAGASIPSYTVAEESYVKTMDVKTPADVTANAQTGDLLFWGGHGQTYHVAIYIGNGQYVAAPQPGMNVEVEPVSTYFMPSFIGRY